MRDYGWSPHTLHNTPKLTLFIVGIVGVVVVAVAVAVVVVGGLVVCLPFLIFVLSMWLSVLLLL